MNKIILCNYVEFAPCSSFESVDGEIVVFKDKSTWKRLQGQSKVIYQSNTETPDPGTIVKETITIIADCDKMNDMNNAVEFYILRLYTNEGRFLVGSLNYPAIKTFSNDKIRANILFSRSSTL